MLEKEIKIENSWRKALSDEFAKDYFSLLSNFVISEYKGGAVYPSLKNILKAFDECPYNKVRVVIIGQDPYHGMGQANGLCFAVGGDGLKIAIPPSLKNIFKEIESDLNIKTIPNGDLTRWAKQGILLLNATLTVRANTPGSHQNKGWEDFTDAVIEKLSKEKENIVFILWGNYARKKGIKIDRKKHLVLEAQHPSPFSAYNGFFGSKHFSQTNKYLKNLGFDEIDWR